MVIETIVLKEDFEINGNKGRIILEIKNNMEEEKKEEETRLEDLPVTGNAPDAAEPEKTAPATDTPAAPVATEPVPEGE